MPNVVEVDSSELLLAYDEITEELDQIIGEEVMALHAEIVQKGQDVYDTGNFKRKIQAPKRLGKYGWSIALKAKYSSILWRGRRTIGNKEYGSLKWYGGGMPMLYKMQSKIRQRFENVQA